MKLFAIPYTMSYHKQTVQAYLCYLFHLYSEQFKLNSKQIWNLEMIMDWKIRKDYKRIKKSQADEAAVSANLSCDWKSQSVQLIICHYWKMMC